MCVQVLPAAISPTAAPTRPGVKDRTTVDGNTYSITRTIKVVNSNIDDFDISLSLESTTESSITYSLTINNQYNLLTTHTAKLYNGAVFVSEINFLEGANTLTFTNLLPETEYNVVIIGTYMSGDLSVSMGDYQLKELKMIRRCG